MSAISWALSLRRSHKRLLGPVALFSFTLSRSFKTPTLQLSGLEKTLVKNVLNISALCSGFVIRVFPEYRGLKCQCYLLLALLCMSRGDFRNL